MTTLVLTVGLPGTGKTTHARRVAAERRMLRLTPDDWMAPLFGRSDVDLGPHGARDVLEGRMIWVAHEVLLGGGSVVLDFGCWSPEERWAIRSVAELAGASFELAVLELSETERRLRSTRRWAEAPQTTFEMSEADHDRFVAGYRPPTADELTGPLAPPPAGSVSWPAWASGRWPSLPRLDLPG